MPEVRRMAVIKGIAPVSVDPAAAGSRPPARAADAPVMLSAHDVYKTYHLERVEVPVLRGASIEVRQSEWVAILGASGSGKSTLLHLLGGLDRPDRTLGAGGRATRSSNTVPSNTVPSNTVTFRDQALGDMSVRELDRYRNASVGFVFQFYHLLPELNVAENTLVPAMVMHGRMGFARRRAELTARAHALLDSFGLGHRMKHRPAALSGGERQRVAIARALINDPPLLLADEPTGNLDRATGESILELITRHRAQTGRTLVMVTHDPEVAARADRIVRLVDGRVAEERHP